ncbi:hypothetical protein ACLBWX_01995 [Methylobacterium sp. M6A4_1b]
MDREAVGARVLELMVENTELRLQLAEAQEQCIEMAVDAGALQAEIDALRDEVASLRAGRMDPR